MMRVRSVLAFAVGLLVACSSDSPMAGGDVVGGKATFGALTLSMDGLRRGWRGSGGDRMPSSGNRFDAIMVGVENGGSSPQTLVRGNLRLGSGTRFHEPVSDLIGPDPILPTELVVEPGRIGRGWVVFELATEEKSIRLLWSPQAGVVLGVPIPDPPPPGER